MKQMKKTLALFCALLLLLALAPAAFADLDSAVPDRELVNSENGFVAAIYDDGGLFSDEEMDLLLEPMEGCSAWFNVLIVTDDRSADEITKDTAFLNVCPRQHLVLVFGRERKDMRVQWDFSSGEDEVLDADEVAGLFGGAKGGYLETGSAFESASEFMGGLLTALQESGRAPAAGTEESTQYYQFRTEEELRRILDRDTDPENEIYVSDLEDLDRTLEKDLLIPAGKVVFFGEGTLTVAPGITVTVEEGAGLFFYGLDVQGTVINNGDLVQCEQLNGGEQLPILIEGEVVNRDWFSFYNIAGGMERIENQGEGRLYSSKEGKRVSPDGSSPSPALTPGSSQKPSGTTGGTKRSSMDTGTIASVVWVIIFVMIIASKRKVKTAKKAAQRGMSTRTALIPSRQAPGRKVAAGVSRPNFGTGKAQPRGGLAKFGRDAEEPLHCAHSRGKEKYFEQLDSFLQNGLIDKKEYQQLKARYSSLDIGEDYH